MLPSRRCGEGGPNGFSERRFKDVDVLLNGATAYAAVAIRSNIGKVGGATTGSLQVSLNRFLRNNAKMQSRPPTCQRAAPSTGPRSGTTVARTRSSCARATRCGRSPRANCATRRLHSSLLAGPAGGARTASSSAQTPTSSARANACADPNPCRGGTDVRRSRSRASAACPASAAAGASGWRPVGRAATNWPDRSDER